MNFMKFFSAGVRAHVCIGLSALGVGSAVVAAAGGDHGPQAIVFESTPSDIELSDPSVVELDHSPISEAPADHEWDTQDCIAIMSGQPRVRSFDLTSLCGPDVAQIRADHILGTYDAMQDDLGVDMSGLRMNF